MRQFTMRPEIMDFAPYKPGLSIEQIKEQYGLTNVIKLASNENPLGVSPVVQKTIAGLANTVFRYPENHSPRLTEALSKHLGVAEQNIVVGNGSDEIIDMLIRTKCRPGVDHVLCYEHSFSMYKLTATLCGVEYREIPRDENMGLPLVGLAEAANENTALIFLTSPDNPTGLAASLEDITTLAGVLPHNCLLVVDEAYIDFTWPPESYTPMDSFDSFTNLVVLRTFSKAYGLAGLRLGYGVMPAFVADSLKRARIPFTVNALAEAAGVAALQDEEFYTATLDVTMRGREYLLGALEKLGCAVLPSQGNFVLFTPPVAVAGLFENLLKKGIIVRPLANFGLEQSIRVSVGTEKENQAFIQAMSEVLADG